MQNIPIHEQSNCFDAKCFNERIEVSNQNFLDVDNDIFGIKTNIGVIKTDATSLSTKVNNVESTFNTKINNTNTNVTNLTNRVTNLENKPAPQGVPSGVIMLWSGTRNNIPSGWVLCDGSNNTPNLVDRFVMGTANSPKTTGGSSNISLSESQMPRHKHPLVNENNQNIENTINSKYGVAYSEQPYSYKDAPPTTSSSTTAVTNHTYMYVGYSGSGSSINILNPYYRLCYIMKT